MSITQLAQWIKESDNVVFFGGAGVSTESGIKDFRSENGIFQAISEFGYSPETLLSHSVFMSHGDVFWDYYRKSLVTDAAQPNPAHIALAKLEEMGKLKAVVTQNIDGLHQKAGSKNVYELHGSTFRNYCMKCGKQYGMDVITSSTGIPSCPACGGQVRPDVVLYEEALDSDVLEGAVLAISRADVLIIGGTSLVVYPAAGLIRYYRGKKLVLMNKTETPYDHEANLIIREPIGAAFAQVMKELNIF